MNHFVSIEKALNTPHLRLTTSTADCPVLIYALHDRRDGLVRYVGKTVSSMAARIDRHFRWPCNEYMRKWLADAGKANVVPTVLEYVSRESWEGFERGWIDWFRCHGWLLNRAPGGLNHISAATMAAPKPRPAIIGTAPRRKNEPKKRSRWATAWG